MKQPELKITIQNPCSENWDAMHIQTTGRYCETCSTVVVDFTKMSDEELILFLKQRRGDSQKMCGRFKTNQLNRSLEVDSKNLKYNEIQVEPQSFYQLKFAWQKFLWMLLALMGLFVLDSCTTSPVTGKAIKTEIKDTLQGQTVTEHELMGDTTYVQPVDTAKIRIIKTQKSTIKMGKVIRETPLIMEEIQGEIMGGPVESTVQTIRVDSSAVKK